MVDLHLINNEMDDERPDDKKRGAEASHAGMDDIGLARRLLIYFGDDLRYVPGPGNGTRQTGSWFVWQDGSHWAKATDQHLPDLAMAVLDRMPEEIEHVLEADRTEHLKFAERSRCDRSIRAMIHLAAGIKSHWALPETFDSFPYYANTANCTIDLDRAGLVPGQPAPVHPHRREDRLTRVCSTPYVPGITSPLLDSFLDTFLPDPDQRRYLLTALAVAVLVDGNPQRAMLMIIGESTTGKSTLTELLEATFGCYVTTIARSVFVASATDRPRPDLLAALTSRLAISTEASSTWLLDADQIKRLTGGDGVPRRGMYSNQMLNGAALCTPLIVTNHTPGMTGVDEAMLRRLRAMTMNVQVPAALDTGAQREALVADPLARAAFLALLVQHYVNAGGMIPDEVPINFRWATEQIAAELDPVDSIMRELFDAGIIMANTEATPAQCITLPELHRLYLDRLRGRRTKDAPMTSRALMMRLRTLHYQSGKSSENRVLGVVRTGVATPHFMIP